MEGLGGYQFVGCILQMWNCYCIIEFFELGKFWLLWFFDQVCFYEVSVEELQQIWCDFFNGDYLIKVEYICFNFKDYEQFLVDNDWEICDFIGQ